MYEKMSVFNQENTNRKIPTVTNEDNENMVSDGTTTICEKEEPTTCLEHECGAFYDGRCHYSEHK